MHTVFHHSSSWMPLLWLLYSVHPIAEITWKNANNKDELLLLAFVQNSLPWRYEDSCMALCFQNCSKVCGAPMCGALRWGKTWCFHVACHRSSAALIRPYRSKHSLILLSAVLRACVRMWVCHNSNTKKGQDGWKAAGPAIFVSKAQWRMQILRSTAQRRIQKQHNTKKDTENHEPDSIADLYHLDRRKASVPVCACFRASYIVREWLLWVVVVVVVVVERERRLWRHRYHAEFASDHAHDYLDGVLTLRVDTFWACWVLEVHVQTRSLALERPIEQQGRVIDEWRSQSGSFAFAGQPAVDHPAAFRWHASSKKNRPSWCLFPFRMAPVLPLRRAWIADILSQASMRDVERQLCWKRGSGDGQRLWDYCTAWLSDLSMPLTGEVRRSPEPSARSSAAADSEERQICATWVV